MSTRDKRLALNRWLLLGARSLNFTIAAGIPTLTLLWADRGLSQSDFYLLEIAFAVILFALEIATGRFSDYFGRVLTLKLGFCAHIVGTLTYAFAQSFTGYLVGEAFFALGIALHSGTDEAFLFQSIKARKGGDAGNDQKAEHQQWWTVMIGCGFVVMGFSSLIGTWASTRDLAYPYVFAGVCQLVALFLCFLMVEPPQEAHGQLGATGSLREAITSVVFASGAVRWMMIVPGFILSVNQTFLWTYTDILRECTLSTMQSGYVFAFFNFVAGVTSLLVRKVTDDGAGTRIVFALLIGLMASTVGLLTTAGALVWLVLIPQQMVRSLSGSLFSQTINDAIPDRVRATALSVRNGFRVVLYVAVMMPWWLGIEGLGRQGMFGVNLAVLCLGGVVLWITHQRVRIAEGF